MPLTKRQRKTFIQVFAIVSVIGMLFASVASIFLFF